MDTTKQQSSQNLTDRLMRSSSAEIPMLERNLSISSILTSSEPSVLILRQKRFEELVSFATMAVTAYLGYCFPNQIGIAGMFASDLIDQRPDWKAADLLLCFKFIRTRQDLPELNVLGNNITPQKLNEMICVYEEQRAMEREKLHASRKGDFSENNKQLDEITKGIAEKIASKTYEKKDEVLGKQLEATEAKLEQERMKPNYKPPVTKVPDERYFEKTLLK